MNAAFVVACVFECFFMMFVLRDVGVRCDVNSDFLCK